MTYKSVKTNLILNMILTASAFIFPLITYPYVTRVLQPSGNGKIVFANSIITYLGIISSLGIPTYGIRVCAQVRDDKELLSKTVQELWMINMVMTILSYIVLAFLIFMIPKIKEEKILIIVCSMALFFNLIGMEWLYKSLELYSYITVRSIVFKVIAVMLMFIFVRNKADYIWYAAIIVIANTGYGIWNALNLKKYICWKRYTNYDIKKHLKPIVIFGAMTVAVTIYSNMDITMLGFIKDNVEVGYYDVAIKIKVILVNVVTALGAVLLPRASYYVKMNMEKEFWQTTSKALEFITVLSMPLIIGFIIMAKPCIMLIAGMEYIPSIQPMQIIMPVLFLIGASNVFGIQILVPLGRENIVLYSEIAGAMVNLGFNVILIPRYGASGAAFGTVMAEITVLLVQMFVLRNHAIEMMKKVQWKKILVALLVSSICLMYLNTKLNTEFNTFVIMRFIVLFSIYGIIYGLLLLLLKEDVVVEIFASIRERVGIWCDKDNK